MAPASSSNAIRRSLPVDRVRAVEKIRTRKPRGISKKPCSSGKSAQVKKFVQKQLAEQGIEETEVHTPQVITPEQEMELTALLKRRKVTNNFSTEFTSRRPRENLEFGQFNTAVKQTNSDKCFNCHQKAGRKGILINCHGNCGSTDCTIKMHVCCAQKYNAEGITINYAAQQQCQNKILCPLHVCSACDRECMKQRAYHGKIIQCLKCHRGFHEECFPAGAEMKVMRLETENGEEVIDMMICPDHVEEEIVVKKHLECCEKCKNVDNLRNCNKCPRSFHPQCREVVSKDAVPISPDEESCDFCISEATIRIGSLVIFNKKNLWLLGIVEGSSRFGEVRLNVKKADVLEFVSLSEIVMMKPVYMQKLRTRQYNKWRKELEAMGKKKLFGPMYKRVNEEIQTSVPAAGNWPRVNSKRYKNCLDYSNHFYDCPEDCRLAKKGKCENRRLAKKQVFSGMVLAKFKTRGYGVMATERIEKGVFLGEYAGEGINKNEFIAREKVIADSKDKEAPRYFMEISPTYYVDGAARGNISRYFNHSCSPNANAFLRTVIDANGRAELRLFVETVRNIEKGEEITIDYKWDTNVMICECGAKNCRSKNN